MAKNDEKVPATSGAVSTVKLAKKVIDLDAKSVEFQWGDNTVDEITLEGFPAEIQLHLALAGISHTLGDAYSAAKGVVSEAKRLFGERLTALRDGEWRQARGSGETKPRIGELAEALARIKGLDIAVVSKALEAADEASKKTLRSNEHVKATIAAIRNEKAQARLAKSRVAEPELNIPGL